MSQRRREVLAQGQWPPVASGPGSVWTETLTLFSGEFVKSLLSLKNQFSGILQKPVQNPWVLATLPSISRVTLGKSLQDLLSLFFAFWKAAGQIWVQHRCQGSRRPVWGCSTLFLSRPPSRLLTNDGNC
jgi:hypothetical protein